MVEVGIDDGGIRLSMEDIELAPSLDDLTKAATKDPEVASNLAPAISSLKQAIKMASALLVTSGATVECSQMRDKKEVKLKGSGSGIKVGSVEALTVLDTTFKPKDFGICKKLTAEAVKKWEKASKKGKRPEVKCVPDLPLYMWEDADNSTVISSSPALHKLCTLKCSHKGTIKIVTTGQGSKNDELLEGIDPSILGGYLVLAGLGVYSEKWPKSGKISMNSVLGYGNGAFQDGSLEFIGGKIGGIDDSMPNPGNYMKGFSNGSFSWDAEGYSNAFTNSMMKKGFKNSFGFATFGLDYALNRDDGESVGQAFAHTATTTVFSTAGALTIGAEISIAATGAYGGTALAAATLLSPVGLGNCHSCWNRFFSKSCI